MNYSNLPSFKRKINFYKEEQIKPDNPFKNEQYKSLNPSISKIQSETSKSTVSPRRIQFFEESEKRKPVKIKRFRSDSDDEFTTKPLKKSAEPLVDDDDFMSTSIDQLLSQTSNNASSSQITSPSKYLHISAIGKVACPKCLESVEITSSKKSLQKAWISYKKSMTSHRDRDNERHFSFAFCKLHKAYSKIIPQGQAKGYPTQVDFEKVATRINQLLPVVFKQVYQLKNGHYYKLALERYEKLGKSVASNVKYKFKHIDQIKCGYYGYKTNALIAKVILKSSYKSEFDQVLLKPFSLMEFVQDILVPEIGWRLIQQDYNCNQAKAIEIMFNSREYGDTLYGESSDEGD